MIGNGFLRLLLNEVVVFFFFFLKFFYSTILFHFIFIRRKEEEEEDPPLIPKGAFDNPSRKQSCKAAAIAAVWQYDDETGHLL